MKLLLEHQMMDKSALICNTSFGKPVIPKKPSPPPKPNLSALHQSSHVRSTGRKDQALRDFEPRSGKLMAVSYNNGRHVTDLSGDSRSLGVKTGLPYSTKTETNSGYRPRNENKIVEENTHQMAVDHKDVGRSGSYFKFIVDHLMCMLYMPKNIV